MIRRTFWAALPACLLLLLLTGTAAGHASLVESDPPDGGTIQTPYTLTARFDEPLEPRSRIVVRELGDSTELARGGVSADDPELMTVELDLSDGEYVARWTAVTADGGVTRGEIGFNVRGRQPVGTDGPLPPRPTAAPSTSGASPSPIATASPTSGPTSSPRASPSPSPSPTPAEPGTTDLLIALLVAGGVVGLIAVYLLRRGRS